MSSFIHLCSCVAAQEYKSAVHDYDISKELEIIEAKDIGTFYKFVNRRIGRKHNIGILQTDSGQYITTNEEKAELLNSYFSSVNSPDNGVVPTFQRRVANDVKLDCVDFNSDAILKVSKKIKFKITADPDGYSYYLLKQILPGIVSPLSMMFESFMSVGKVPTGWKTAIITPLFKKGISSQVSNYRPISLTSIFSKLMERVVAEHLIAYLRDHNLISKAQHGFLSRRSTVRQLIF